MVWMNPKSYSLNRLSIFLHAPAKSGVYLLHNSSRCLYIGDSDNIRQTLRQHLRDDNSAITLFDPDGFSFELQPEASRARRKDQLSSELEPAIESWGGTADEASFERLPHGVKFPLARY
jgi:hypothetical protein